MLVQILSETDHGAELLHTGAWATKAIQSLASEKSPVAEVSEALNGPEAVAHCLTILVTTPKDDLDSSCIKEARARARVQGALAITGGAGEAFQLIRRPIVENLLQWIEDAALTGLLPSDATCATGQRRVGTWYTAEVAACLEVVYRRLPMTSAQWAPRWRRLLFESPAGSEIESIRTMRRRTGRTILRQCLKLTAKEESLWQNRIAITNLAANLWRLDLDLVDLPVEVLSFAGRHCHYRIHAGDHDNTYVELVSSSSHFQLLERLVEEIARDVDSERVQTLLAAAFELLIRRKDLASLQMLLKLFMDRQVAMGSIWSFCAQAFSRKELTNDFGMEICVVSLLLQGITRERVYQGSDFAEVDGHVMKGLEIRSLSYIPTLRLLASALTEAYLSYKKKITREHLELVRAHSAAAGFKAEEYDASDLNEIDRGKSEKSKLWWQETLVDSLRTLSRVFSDSSEYELRSRYLEFDNLAHCAGSESFSFSLLTVLVSSWMGLLPVECVEENTISTSLSRESPIREGFWYDLRWNQSSPPTVPIPPKTLDLDLPPPVEILEEIEDVEADPLFLKAACRAQRRLENPVWTCSGLLRCYKRLVGEVLPGEVNLAGASLALAGRAQQFGVRLKPEGNEKMWIQVAVIQEDMPRQLVDIFRGVLIPLSELESSSQAELFLAPFNSACGVLLNLSHQSIQAILRTPIGSESFTASVSSAIALWFGALWLAGALIQSRRIHTIYSVHDGNKSPVDANSLFAKLHDCLDLYKDPTIGPRGRLMIAGAFQKVTLALSGFSPLDRQSLLLPSATASLLRSSASHVCSKLLDISEHGFKLMADETCPMLSDSESGPFLMVMQSFAVLFTLSCTTLGDWLGIIDRMIDISVYMFKKHRALPGTGRLLVCHGVATNCLALTYHLSCYTLLDVVELQSSFKLKELLWGLREEANGSKEQSAADLCISNFLESLHGERGRLAVASGYT